MKETARTIRLRQLLQASGFFVDQEDKYQNKEFGLINDVLIQIIEQMEKSGLIYPGSQPYVRGSCLGSTLTRVSKGHPALLAETYEPSPDSPHYRVDSRTKENFILDRMLIATTHFKQNVDIYFPVQNEHDAMSAAIGVIKLIAQVNDKINRNRRNDFSLCSCRITKTATGIIDLNIEFNGGNPLNNSINIFFKPINLLAPDMRSQVSARQDALRAPLSITGRGRRRRVVATFGQDQVDTFHNQDEIKFIDRREQLTSGQFLELLARTVRFNARFMKNGQVLSEAQIKRLHDVLIEHKIYQTDVSLIQALRTAAEFFWAFLMEPYQTVNLISRLPENILPNLDAQHFLKQADEQGFEWEKFDFWEPGMKDKFFDHLVVWLGGQEITEGLKNTRIGQAMHQAFVSRFVENGQKEKHLDRSSSTMLLQNPELFGYLMFLFLPVDTDVLLELASSALASGDYGDNDFKQFIPIGNYPYPSGSQDFNTHQNPDITPTAIPRPQNMPALLDQLARLSESSADTRL